METWHEEFQNFILITAELRNFFSLFYIGSYHPSEAGVMSQSLGDMSQLDEEYKQFNIHSINEFTRRQDEYTHR